ncbi:MULTISPECIES: LexA regulated protein [unclassified Motilimonas]|uniref:LexA regulated protein n=1 Tax=Motilimonas TaxID=1914248 RepID=UPI001E54B12B|nr:MULTISPECIES: LexA regulated protein [unclassified Motilimonas]MCE0556734.1 LexA regulated protein [Motilimonas sp. E26]MDO6526781.1 LexA regulated protein [Motilimonas sp. 1_MG-2023]
MAKELTDRTTIDLFSEDKRPGRPKTNPLSREQQLKINKRNQIKRDKAKGLRRVELKVEQQLFEQLNDLALQQNISRSELIVYILEQQLTPQ